MMYDYLIIGQGLAGTILSQELLNKGKSVMVIDNHHKSASSKIAAGIINPVTGRRYVKSWMIDELLVIANETYKALEKQLNVELISRKNIVRMLHSHGAVNDWQARLSDPQYQAYLKDDSGNGFAFGESLKKPLGYGVIKNGMQINIPLLIERYRNELLTKKALVNDGFEHEKLEIKQDEIEYQGIRAKQVVFCQGAQGRQNPMFDQSAFKPNKGEVLYVEVPGLKLETIIRDQVFLFQQGKTIWSGGGYDHFFKDEGPTEAFREKQEAQLTQTLKSPFVVKAHKAAIRMATKDRRPVIGTHVSHKHIHIFNGFGAKGSSLIPYFAKHLVQHLLFHSPLDKAVDLDRFN